MNLDETRNEIIKRSKKIAQKRRKTTIRIMEIACVSLIMSIVLIMNNISAKSTDVVSTYYGTMKLSPEAGLYVLIGLSCFILGVLITLLGINIKKEA